MLAAVFVILLVLVGVGALYGLWRLLSQVEARAEEINRQTRNVALTRATEPEITGALGPDGIVYLAAHRFLPAGTPRNVTNVRRRAYAPLTGDEVEPRQMAEQLLYATFVTLAQADDLVLRITECEPSFMPPFPHKRWTMRASRVRRLTGSPTAEALDCAFDIAEQRSAKRGGNVEEGIPLDELIEDMLKVMRQELSFWEKAGIYADIRQYVEAALIDQGYLIAPTRDTWFDKLRHLRPIVNERAVAQIDRLADELAEQLADFRCRQGSSAAATADTVPGGRTEEVDEGIIEAGPPFDGLPLHDCLKVSLYEATMAIRQLEPSEDVGV